MYNCVHVIIIHNHTSYQKLHCILVLQSKFSHDLCSLTGGAMGSFDYFPCSCRGICNTLIGCVLVLSYVCMSISDDCSSI